MLSLKTCIELINVIDNYVVRVVDRIFVVFDIEHLIDPTLGKLSKDNKVNILLKTLKQLSKKGPFTDSFHLDLLQYMVDHFYRYEDENGSNRYVSYDPNYILQVCRQFFGVVATDQPSRRLILSQSIHDNSRRLCLTG